MRKAVRVFSVLAAVCLAAVATPRLASAQDIAVKNPRIVVSATDATDARLVATIDNPGMYPAYLVSGTSAAAEKLELRDARKNNAVVKEVEIPAFGALSLDAKGLYLKLVKPKGPLKIGTKVEVVLLNELQEKTKVTATVAAR